MFRAAYPAPTGNALAAINAHDTYGTWVNDLGAYLSLFEHAPLIADAIGFSSRIANVQEGIWDAIDAAETAGGVADLTDPAATPASPFSTPGPYETDCDYTRAEAIASYSAKVAHALYLEVHNVVPWSITNYGLDALQGIFDPEEQFFNNLSVTTWDPDGATPASSFLLIDHSPSRSYAEAQPTIGTATTSHAALNNLIAAIGPTTKHSITTDPLWAITVDLARDYDDLGTPADETNRAVNRTGCPFAGRIIRALARSINIGAKDIHDSYNGGGHDSTIFPQEGIVLRHGDDINNASYLSRPFSHWAGDYAYWQANIIGAVDNYLKVQRTIAEQARSYNSWDDLTGISFATYEFNNFAVSVYSEHDGFYKVLRDKGGAPLPDKPTSSNTGTEGALTPTSGRTITDTGYVTIQDEDITGTMTINTTGNALQFRNCKIDGSGGVGISLGVARDVWLTDCEITNCTVAVQGPVTRINGCYFHDNDTNAQIEGTSYLDTPVRVYGSYFGDTTGINCRVTGNTENVLLLSSTFLSTASANVIESNAAMPRGLLVHRCYIDGGTNAYAELHFSGTVTQITDCQFGRTSSSGLLSSSGQTPTWTNNVYENDLSTALITDTAPL